MPAWLTRTAVLAAALAFTNIAGAEPARLDSVEIVSLNGRFKLPGYTNRPDLVVTVVGSFTRLEISTTPTFNAPSLFNPDPTNRYPYALQRFTYGDSYSVPIYLRAFGDTGEPALLTTTLHVDTTPPNPFKPATPKPPAGRRYMGLDMPFEWTPCTDPNGVAGYDYEVGIVTFEGIREYPGFTTEPNVRQVVESGGYTRCRIRAVDRVGNAGQWSDYSGNEIYTFGDDKPFLLRAEPPTQFASRTLTPTWVYLGESPLRAMMQVSLDPQFAEFHEEVWEGHRTALDVSNLADGTYTVYHRFTSSAGAGNTVFTKIVVDNVPPDRPNPIPTADYGADGSMAFNWQTTDPSPSSGRGDGTMALYRTDYDTTRPITTVGVRSNIASIRLPAGIPGGNFRVQLRVADGVGNTSEPGFSRPFRLNGRPGPPTILVQESYPTGEYIVPVVTGGLDPDGDPVTYRSWFVDYYLWPFQIPRYVDGTYLRLSSVSRWSFVARAEDSKGAIGDSFEVGINLVDGLPSDPTVRIAPATPRPGEALRAQLISESIDPDGDPLQYRYRWFRRQDPQSEWVEEVQLENPTEVPGSMVIEGEEWKVTCDVYQEILSPTGVQELVAGGSDSDEVSVSATNLVRSSGWVLE